MPIESGHDPIRGIGLIQEITGEIDLVQEIAGEIDLDLDQEIIGVDYTLQGDKIIIFFLIIIFFIIYFFFIFILLFFFFFYYFLFFFFFYFFSFFLIIKNFSQKIFKNFISNNSDSLLKLNYFDFDFKFN